MAEDEERKDLSQGTTAPELFETNTHSFVLRIWREELREANGASVWRGHITHVQSGERRYFQRLREIVTFIASYLLPADHTMARPLSRMARVQRWLCRWLHCTDESQS
ncbi:MAG: hypothetical protein R3C14_10645 [Caldilineaceae bacterium]